MSVRNATQDGMGTTAVCPVPTVVVMIPATELPVCVTRLPVIMAIGIPHVQAPAPRLALLPEAATITLVTVTCVPMGSMDRRVARRVLNTVRLVRMQAIVTCVKAAGTAKHVLTSALRTVYLVRHRHHVTHVMMDGMGQTVLPSALPIASHVRRVRHVTHAQTVFMVELVPLNAP